jgi:tRNA (guanine6-N2)-methyltransferase
VTTIIARCVHGLEWVGADEIASRWPSATSVRLARREVVFELSSVDAGLLDLRTVDDLFVRVGGLDEVATTREGLRGLGRRVAALPFDTDGPPPGPRVDVVASVEGRRTYSRFEVEQAVGPAVAARLGGSYLTRAADGRAPGDPDVSVRLFLRGTALTVATRLGPRPRHRRPYKQDTGAGTLHPPVAAALARLACPADGAVVLDPFCGDGTIAIETAMAYPRTRALGSDLDPLRLGNAAANAARAGVRPAFVRADAGRLPVRPGSMGAVVTNPPWSLAVDAGGRLDASLEEFWVRLGEPLAADGRVCLVADEGLDAPGTARRLGWPVGLAARNRLAGRVSHVVLCGVPGGAAPRLDAGLARWRERAIADGVVTDTGF